MSNATLSAMGLEVEPAEDDGVVGSASVRRAVSFRRHDGFELSNEVVAPVEVLLYLSGHGLGSPEGTVAALQSCEILLGDVDVVDPGVLGNDLVDD